MKKQTKRNNRKVRRIQWLQWLSILLALILILPVLSPVSALAEPESTPPAATGNREDIAVYSITVNVNSESSEVFTELVLKNEGEKDAQITFPLPVISNGVDYDSLYTAGAGGDPVENSDGMVTLDLKAGDFAGLTYCYQTRRSLSYDRVIAFDLTQLSDYFCDQVGLFNWNVDMPLYEIALVRDIQPVNYRVENNRIRINLTAFTVSPLLNQVSLTRVTHYDLLERVEMAQEKGYPGGTYSDEGIEDSLTFVENYREWFRDPSINFQESAYVVEDLYSLASILKWSRGMCDYTPGNIYTIAFNAQYAKAEPVVYAILPTSQPALAGKKLYGRNTPEPEWIGTGWGVTNIYYSPAEEQTLLKIPATYRIPDSTYRMIYLREEDLSDPAMVQDYLDTMFAKAVIRSQMILKGSEISEKCIITEDGWSWYRAANYSYGGTQQYPYESFANDLVDSLMTMNAEYSLSDEYTLFYQEDPLDQILSIPVLTLYWGVASPVEEDLKEYSDYMDPEDYVIHGDPEPGSYVAEPFTTNTILSPYCGIDLVDRAFNHETPKQQRGDRESEWMQGAVRYGFEYSNALESLKLSDEASLKEAAKAAAKEKPEETKEQPTEPESETEPESKTEPESETEPETETNEPTGAQTEPETEETEESGESLTEAKTERVTEGTTEAQTKSGKDVTTDRSSEAETEEETVKPTPSKGRGGIVAVLVILVLVFGVVIVGLVLILAVIILIVLSKKKHKSKEDIQQ